MRSISVCLPGFRRTALRAACGVALLASAAGAVGPRLAHAQNNKVAAEALFAKLRGRAIKKIVFVHLAREFWADRAGTRRMIASQLGGIPFTIAKDGDVFAV